uniref:Disintegrin and metalloproteinase domain-containing protein 22 n=1 Tax=Steinernema glaseri TaxID=37863 RepID=A0A1I7YFX5_9BILA
MAGALKNMRPASRIEVTKKTIGSCECCPPVELFQCGTEATRMRHLRVNPSGITLPRRLSMWIVFLSTLLLAASLVDAKVNLKHSSTNKQFVSRFDEGEFEVVHPFQVREKSERTGIDTHNYFLNATVHYKHATFVFRSSSAGRLKLIMNLNDYLFFNVSEFKKFDSQGEHSIRDRVENCYYQGTLNGDPSSFVALSTCNGLRGVIAFENGTTYGIWPLDGGDRGRKHPHVLYRVKWSRKANCAAATQVASRAEYLRQVAKRDVTRQTKYVELALIGDLNFMKEFSLSVDDGIEYLLETVNVADLMTSRDLNIRLSVVYSELWIDAQRIDVHDDIERTLVGSFEYVAGHIFHIAKDMTMVFTGGDDFANAEVTTSNFAGVCTQRSTGLIQAIDSLTSHETAQVLAQSVGHVLGMDHDSSECSCDNQQTCVMNKHIGTAGSSFGWQFSKCSVARMHSILQSGRVQCLLNRPFQASQLHQCGNGVVDAGEECDCGPRDECFDPCCDPLTCTLRAHAQCAAHQACCHHCELRKAGHVCRGSRGVCDVVEMCDGMSGDCPADGHLIDGTVCGMDGQCWKGNCSDVNAQCQKIWGPKARSGSTACFEHNAKGLEYGNCGNDRDGSTKKCATENIRCGTLQCSGGEGSPMNSLLNSFNFQFLHEDRQVQCKAITNPLIGLVADGTSCGSGRVCVQGACLPLVQVSPPVYCPSNNLALQCSGHGDCTTTQKCLCYDGWAGVACDIKSNTTRRIHAVPTTTPGLSIPSLTIGRTLETTTLLGILLLVGVCLLALLICLLFCYRRKSTTDHHKNVIHNAEESFQEPSNRAIKFGNMPSYREEKRKRKKNKRVYDALQRISEVTDERDSASLRSKESAATASSASQGAPTPYSGSVDQLMLAERMIDRESSLSSGILKNSSSRRLFDDRHPSDTIYSESLGGGDMNVAMVESPTRSDFYAMQRSRNNRYGNVDRSGYATDNDMVDMMEGPYGSQARYVRKPHLVPVPPPVARSCAISPTSSSHNGSSLRLAPTPLKLNNIGMLLKQLNYEDRPTELTDLTNLTNPMDRDHLEEIGSNTESSRGGESCSEYHTNPMPRQEPFVPYETPIDPQDKSLTGVSQSPLFNDHYKLDVT